MNICILSFLSKNNSVHTQAPKAKESSDNKKIARRFKQSLRQHKMKVISQLAAVWKHLNEARHNKAKSYL